MEWWGRFRRKFWLTLYLWAGRHVGPEADEYWDQHWWEVVAFRLKELGDSDLGLNTMRLLFFDTGDLAGDVRGREYRVRARESRDGRA